MHKDTIAVALAASGLRGEVREYGKIPNTPAALKALAVKLARTGSDGWRDRLEAHLEAVLPEWSLAPVVEALQALRGVRLVAAATLVAELGDITRFTNPR